ncbi:hypothetical protein EDC14_100147 [Hydrogenispora ethanolica]|uniref:Uncharacterized protein n=1 Tax=Hydrogenispora ethanolica TaxID=1082276 RepID=A0A4V2QGQ5_HYDET|nr:hypothetical protein [Hydrogenispora ethanolica]TCL76767.1 hypothetical protein EDC14_100147 [Hydrogenispora ethanolica]
MKKYYADLLFAAVAVYWFTKLDFARITPLQYAIFGLIAVWAVLFVMKLRRNRR